MKIATYLSAILLLAVSGFLPGCKAVDRKAEAHCTMTEDDIEKDIFKYYIKIL